MTTIEFLIAAPIAVVLGTIGGTLLGVYIADRWF